MKQLKYFAVMLVIVLVSCSKDEPVIETQRSNDSQVKSLNKPFSASGTFNNKLAQGECEGYLRSITAGDGQSITIGNFILNGSYCYGQCSESDLLSLAVNNSRWTFTVGNGNMLDLTYSDACLDLRSDLTNPYGNFPVFVFQGSYEITGGTGMYHGTTGTGSLQITQYLDESGGLTTAEFHLNGSIKYPYEVIQYEGQNNNTD